jgi:predicted Zn-dependent protease
MTNVKLVSDLVALAKGRYPDADVRVSAKDEWTANTRFARNEPSTNGDIEQTEIAIALAFGRKHATASTNQTDEKSMVDAVDRAASMARLAPDDAEWMPMVGKQDLSPAPAAFDPEVARFDGARRAAAIGAAITEAKAKGVVGAGFLECDGEQRVLADSRGLLGTHQRTTAEMTMTARTKDGGGSGWAALATHRAAELDAGEVGRIASEKGLRSREPRPLDPGKYTVILEPAAVADLMQFFIWAADARRSEEGRSFFSRPGGATKIGEKLFPDTITFESDPRNVDAPGSPFDAEGVPLDRIAWIDRGVVGGLFYSRYWGAKRGKLPTGRHDSFLLHGGTADRPEDLLSGVKRGLLVTRFWYTRWLEPKAMSITGLTRDGVFLIEDGRITGPVHNFRFNESPVNVLANCDAMTRGTTRVPGGDVWRVPTLRTRDFNMASVSAAI